MSGKAARIVEGSVIHSRGHLEQRRAEYGAEIVAALGRQLENRCGRGFGQKNLHRMIQFAEAFPDAEIVAALLRQLGWSHFNHLQHGTARAEYGEQLLQTLSEQLNARFGRGFSPRI